MLHKLQTAGRIEHSSALVNNMADTGTAQLHKVAVDQAAPAPANANTLDPLVHCGADHSTDRGVHARGIAAAGQYADALHLAAHFLEPPHDMPDWNAGSRFNSIVLSL